MIHILTTLYNCEDYIEKCLGSIMGQKYRNFKCYITDDLSTDNSIEKVENMIKEDDRFILIKNSNKFYVRHVIFAKPVKKILLITTTKAQTRKSNTLSQLHLKLFFALTSDFVDQ